MDILPKAQDRIKSSGCTTRWESDFKMHNSFSGFNLKLITRSLKAFSTKGKYKLYFIILWNTLLGFLDLVAIALIGILATLALNGNDSKISERIRLSLDFAGSQDWEFSKLVSVIALTTAGLFFVKTMLSIKFTRRILHYLSSNAANLSSRLVATLLTKPITSLEAKTSHETLYLVTRGVEVVALQILATFFMLIADVFLTLTIFILIFLVDPVTSILAALVFGITGFGLNFILHFKASKMGQRNAFLNVKSNEIIMEVFQSYRELVVGNRRPFYVDKISHIRNNLAFTSAELSFMPYISKYTLEFTVILSAILISGSQFLLNGTSSAVQTLAVFLGAATRLAPAILRIQQAALQLKSSEAMAVQTLDLIENLGPDAPQSETVNQMSFSHLDFIPKVEISSITYTYPSSTNPSLHDVSLKIEPGQHVAIVGPSGAGKSTLVDVILGIVTPDSGTVQISDSKPLDAFSKWPGATAYVPQNIFISTGTIRENLALGYDLQAIPETDYFRAIETAALAEYLSSLDYGLDTEVGELGLKMSGGQKQRLGIARAVISNPLLLVMDEATSSLDGESESAITSAITSLGKGITTITIAHRLSTVIHANQIVYMSEGKILSIGTFEEVRQAIPDFDKQARLLGL
jgi:ABC-type bacteriocin/lantibiotic exporter with double-glycine peptidase domain